MRNENGGDAFRAPVTLRGPKLYVFASYNRLVYVGQTIQGMRTRLRQGFKADGTSGYHGYEWRKSLKQADLYIWCMTGGPEEKALALECIESEIVFLCRKVYGQWPSCQTEIHFHESTQEHRNLAAQVFRLFNHHGP